MKWKDMCGMSVVVIDKRTKEFKAHSGKLIRVSPDWKIVLQHDDCRLEDVKLAKGDELEMITSYRGTDRLIITRGQPKEKRMKVEPIGLTALKALEDMFRDDKADQFDAMAAMKLG